jgi:hypothetical protein
MAKLNRTRSVTSLQPNERNGHKPSIVTSFWGDKSVGMRGTHQGAGKKIELEAPKTTILLWYENLKPIDPVSLKEVKPVTKAPVKPEKKKADLFDLVKQFQQKRTQ